MSFDVIDLFCNFCRFSSHVDIDEIRKNGAYCQNCGKCLHEKDSDFGSKDDMTEQEKISEVIWKNRRK